MVAAPEVEANARRARELREEVTALKNEYCQHLDAKRWDRWATLFAEDAVLQVGPDAGSSIRGRCAIRKLLETQLRRARTHHKARNPEIFSESPDRVRVVWEMDDVVETPLYRLEGSGFYEDHYVRDAGAWRISTLRLHRTKVDLRPKSRVMGAVLWAHGNGVLRRVLPSADRALGDALHVGLRVGERP